MTLHLYIRIARILHWLLAVLIVVAIGLGLYAADQSDAAGAPALRLTWLYALHKTVGMWALMTAVVFAVWLATPPKRRPPPAPRWPVVLWQLTFWGLAIAMILLPLTGPRLHANGPAWGYAAPWWPLPARVPGMPDSFAATTVITALHRDGWWLFAGLAVVHTALYFRRRRERRRGTVQPPPAPGPRAPILRLMPLAGAALWAIALVMLA